MNGNDQAAGLFDRTGVRYEVACDVIGALIAHYAEIVGIERSRPQPDDVILREAGAIQSMLSRVRDELDSRDTDAIEVAISRYAPLARQFYGFAQNDAERRAQRAEGFRQANASLALEGLHVDAEDLVIQARVIRGEINHDEAVALYRQRAGV